MHNVAATSPPLVQECPVCHASIPVYAEYVTWCDQCSWNLQPQEPGRPRTLFESFYAKLGKQSSQTLFDAVVKAESLQPRLTLSKIAAFILAALVHGLTLGFAALAVALLVKGWPNIFAIIGAVICAMVAWNIRPQVAKLPDAIVSRAAFPTLYKVCGAVAQALGASDVDGIVIDHRFNAAFGHAGWGQKTILYLGLPLFSILDDREKIALIAHELAHGVNGDPTRGFVVGTAIQSLIRWHRLLRPDRLWEANRYGRGTHTSFVALVGSFFTNIFMLCLSVVPWLCAYALSLLLWRESQRAEYLADHLAARVAGTDAALSLLEKLHFGDTLALAVQRIALNRSDQSIFDEVQRRMRQMPQRELERIRRLERMQTARLDVTHPPTAYRVDLLEARPIAEPQLVITPPESEQLACELATVQKRIQVQLLDMHRRNLYY